MMPELPNPPERRRLPGAGEPAGSAPAGWSPPVRRDGLRHVRRMSNWTAAALIAATIVTTGYLARGSVSTATPSAATRASSPGTAPAGTSGTAGTHKTCVNVPVATSGGSGVTAQKTAQACGTGTSGKPIVVYVTRPSNNGDS